MSLLTAFHFIFTYSLLETMCRIGLFQRANEYPVSRRWYLACFGIGSVIFMNFNLAKNSVGFYQLSKLCGIPVIVVLNYFLYKKTTPLNILLSLVVLLTGVGLYSVNDVELNLVGSIIAVIAVLTTAVFQIQCGSDQKSYSISGTQVQHATALPQFILASAASVSTEVINPKHTVLKHPFVAKEIILIVLTGFFAVGVNVSCFGLIGKTSPLTYQVVGHVKTILILIAGFVLFPPTQAVDPKQELKTKIGVCISMVGIVLYTYFGLTNNKPTDEKKLLAQDEEDKDTKNLLSDRDTLAKDMKMHEEVPLPSNLFPEVEEE